ncbi:S16 family serine protease [Motilimonas eburnea]|uniref:S16 family serine protease n=1 Tax=Motilimonas eburnea TaxID=1737488 RepID=UPI001E640F8D|nr:S16 family serine protease [Motilimonas eburnea]MCE2570381.1 AAA family ATPase [Motilimonas eburnea]
MPKLAPLLPDSLQPDFSQLIDAVADLPQSPWKILFPYASQQLTDAIALPHRLITLCMNDWATGIAFIDSTLSSLPESPLYQCLNSYGQLELFGEVTLEADALTLSPGAILQQQNGLLGISLPPLLENPQLWYQVKGYLLSGILRWHDGYGAKHIKKMQLPKGEQPRCKLILIGSRSQFAELNQLDPEFSALTQQFCEIADEAKVTSASISAIIALIEQQAALAGITKITTSAKNKLLQHLSARRDHQHYVQLNASYLSKLLSYCHYRFGQELTPNAIADFISTQQQAMRLPQHYSDESIVERQIPIALEGKAIGQVNGLSVVELEGHPLEFGEVFRVTAAEFLGDGEVVDVERKAEMAGNIHSKAMMIVESYLSQVFGKEEHVPFSANIVFEQSYSHTDGDSAAVATYVALISALAQLSVRQDVAMTGSMDQAGNVLAVGGINEKVAAIYRTAQLKQLQQPVLVLIPASNLVNLCCDDALVEAVNKQRLIIYPIEHVEQAIEIAIAEVDKVYEAVRTRIKELNGQEEGDTSWLKKLMRYWQA